MVHTEGRESDDINTNSLVLWGREVMLARLVMQTSIVLLATLVTTPVGKVFAEALDSRVRDDKLEFRHGFRRHVPASAESSTDDPMPTMSTGHRLTGTYHRATCMMNVDAGVLKNPCRPFPA